MVSNEINSDPPRENVSNLSPSAPSIGHNQFVVSVDSSRHELSPKEQRVLARVFSGKQFEIDRGPDQVKRDDVIYVPRLMLFAVAELEQHYGSVKFERIYSDTGLGNRALKLNIDGEDLILKMSTKDGLAPGTIENDYKFLLNGFDQFPKLRGTVKDHTGEVLGILRTYQEGATLSGFVSAVLEGLNASIERGTLRDNVNAANVADGLIESFRVALEEMYYKYATTIKMVPWDMKGDNVLVVFREEGGTVKLETRYFDTAKFQDLEAIKELYQLSDDRVLASAMADEMIEAVKAVSGYSELLGKPG
ncbi:MAG: hypothetical protein D6719_10015 [Candidatus Dadabacteria bacterium]|nr:MAG: hypothetical protein D6719_10015 [Candidatus Dadabacteria bacterium]